MANKTIKGLTVEIGGDTTKLGKALESVEKKSSSLSSELGQINKLLKLDPTNTELLAQKQKVLAEAVSNTEDKLDKLKEAEKQVQAQFEKGEASEEQVRALQREIIATEKKLNSYKGAAKETAEAVEHLGDNSGKAADDVNDLAEKEDKAEKEADDLGGTLDGSLSTGLKAVTALAAAAGAAIIGAVEATQEYRTAMGRLDTAFRDSSYNSQTAKKTYKELQSILGETDQAVEASNLLAKLCDTEEELSQMTHALTGVYATFPDSLPIEALAESANETARAGQIAGNLADALNWAAAEGETFGVTMKASTEENEEWNKSVEEAASAEDYFNLALKQCSNQQERQQLIMNTLTRLYGKAGTEYKKTNKAVIEANKANEEWTETLAEVGEEVQPVVTDIKNLGTAFLKDAKEPLKDVASYIRTDVLPAMSSLSTWVRTNGPAIKTTLIAGASTLAAYKTACIATEVAHKGLKGAIMATEGAQKLLNIAQAASPIGLITTAIIGAAGLIVALNMYQQSAQFAAEEVDVLTEEEKELAAAADTAAESFREQQKATDENLGKITAQMDHVQLLANELGALADASGEVKDKDKERAQFILNELNQALGTEYTMTGNIIQNYKDLKTGIDEVIQSKTANLLLEAKAQDYATAIQEKAAAYDNMMLKEKEYQAQLAATAQKEAEYAGQRETLELQLQAAIDTSNTFQQGVLLLRMSSLDKEMQKERDILAEKETAYTDALGVYNGYYTTINDYEAAQTAALQGNYSAAVDILKKKGGEYSIFSDKVDEETAKVVSSLHKEAIDAGLKAELTKQRFEAGVEGYTAEMVKEAEKNYEKALDEFATAYADAEMVGEDLGSGLSGGMENKRSGLLAKAKSLVQGIISAMRKEADSHSPARKTIEFGEDVGEGAEIGIDNKTEDVAKAGQRQAAVLIEAYTDQNVAGQNALRSVAEQQTAMQASVHQIAAADNSTMLGKILEAIEAGQVIALDGDLVVGGTAGRMNKKLGQIQLLTDRGAL